MKKLRLIFITAIIAAAYTVNGFAFADFTEPPLVFSDKAVKKDEVKVKKRLYEEDFTSVEIGEKPGSYSLISSGDTSVGVDDKNSDKKYLRIYDNDPNAHVGFQFRYPHTAKNMLFEIKLRYLPLADTECPFYIRFFENGNQAAQITQWSDGGPVVYFNDNGENRGFTNPEGLAHGEWYTFRLLIKPDDREGIMEVSSEALKRDSVVNGVKAVLSGVRHSKEAGLTYSKGLSLYTTYSGEPVNEIKFLTTGKTGEYHIDYIRVSEADELKYRGPVPARIIPPYTASPVSFARDNRINISFEGVYRNFVFEPFEEEGKIYAPLRTLASWYDLSYEATEKGAVLKTADGKTTNGFEIKEKDGVYYAPVEEFVRVMGDTAEISGNNVVIRGEEK